MKPKPTTMELSRRACTLRGSMLADDDESRVTISEDTDDSKPRRFSITALSGKVLNHPIFGKFAVDISGMRVNRQNKPVLRDHLGTQIVGSTDSIQTPAEGPVTAEGPFHSTADAGEVLSLSDEGFPWEASVFVPPELVENVPEGATASVNGHELTGPAVIFRKSSLREISFTPIGVDEDTAAAALSDRGESVKAEVLITKTEGVQVELSDLTAEQLRESRPDLVAALSGGTDGEGAPPVPAPSDNGGQAPAADAGNDDNTQAADGQTEAAAPAAAPAAAGAGLSADANRVAILNQAAALGVSTDEALRVADSGVDAATAAKLFSNSKLSGLQGGAPASPGADLPPMGDGTPPDALSFEDRTKGEWERDAKLRAEFGTYEVYESFALANSAGLVSTYKA